MNDPVVVAHWATPNDCCEIPIETNVKRSRTGAMPPSTAAVQSYRLIEIRSLRDDFCPIFRQTTGASRQFGERPAGLQIMSEVNDPSVGHSRRVDPGAYA